MVWFRVEGLGGVGFRTCFLLQDAGFRGCECLLLGFRRLRVWKCKDGNTERIHVLLFRNFIQFKLQS